MRNLTALLFLLSLCSLHLVFSAPSDLDYKTECCERTSKVKIPLRNIRSYWRTSTSCPIKAIVFETINKEKKLHRRCVDPTASWVNGHMKAVDLRKKTLSPPPPTIPTTHSVFDRKTGCCTSTTNVDIPLENIVDYWETSTCPIKAIVFETIDKEKTTIYKLCVDPTVSWVEGHMRAADEKKNTKTLYFSGRADFNTDISFNNMFLFST